MEYHYRIELNFDGQWTYLIGFETDEPLDDVGAIDQLIPEANQYQAAVRLLAADGVPTNRRGRLTYNGVGARDIPPGWYFRAVQYPTVAARPSSPL